MARETIGSIKSQKKKKWISDERTQSVECSPSLYLLNAAALSKPGDVERLAADSDVAIVTETHFKSKHTDVKHAKHKRQTRSASLLRIIFVWHTSLCK